MIRPGDILINIRSGMGFVADLDENGRVTLANLTIEPNEGEYRSANLLDQMVENEIEIDPLSVDDILFEIEIGLAE